MAINENINLCEDYVSFETAKLLKEKGFTANIHGMYDHDGKFCEATFTNVEPYYSCYAPTLQMAMKWLRKEHNLCIEPYRTACGYLCTISKIPTGSEIYGQKYEGDDEDSGQFTTYEKACEAAIKYCLNNINSAH